MTQLVWDEVGDRVYQTGLDHGVIYLSDGSAVPWNGLTAIKEKTKNELKEIYFEGSVIHQEVVPGNFRGTINAITYPEEIDLLSGAISVRDGFNANQQMPSRFSMSYRTMIGDDVNGASAGYKIHLLYNLTILPTGNDWQTIGDDSEANEFEWDIFGIPEEVPGLRPTASYDIDSRNFPEPLMDDIQEWLYGTESVNPVLPRMYDLVTYIREWSA